MDIMFSSTSTPGFNSLVLRPSLYQVILEGVQNEYNNIYIRYRLINIIVYNIYNRVYFCGVEKPFILHFVNFYTYLLI